MKVMKSENYKDNLKAHFQSRQSNSKSPEKNKRTDEPTSSDSDRKNAVEGLTATSDEDGLGKMSGKSKKSRSKSRAMLSEIAENVDFEEAEADSSSRKSFYLF
jgi:hypothetical protein